MSVYLIDSNVCVEYLRSGNAGVIQRLRAEPTDNVRLCSVVLGELHYGALRSRDPAGNLTLLRRLISEFTSLPFDDSAAEIYGKVRLDLERMGKKIGPHDTQIAAIALANGLTIVTHNVAEFSRVPGLPVEDWQT